MANRKTAVLFPGKQNHWIIALTGASAVDMRDREQTAVLWFESVFQHPWEDIRVTGSQVGEPEKIRGNFIQRDSVSLPPDTTYVAIAFDYLGELDAIDWPEDDGLQLWAVMQGVPTVHLKTPIEEIGDILDDTVEDVSEDAAEVADNVSEAAKTVSSIVIFGGAIATALWLFGVIKSK